jgi:acyl-CoA synthetase (AMP-forming)/AMP-acid ligase II
MVPILVGGALEATAARAENAIAVGHGRRSITYGELDGYSSALAFALERRGVESGERVAMLLEGPEAIVALWAIAKAGAVGIALDSGDADDLAAILRDTNVRALIADAAVVPTFHHAVARAPALRAVITRGLAPEHAAGSASYVTYETALAEEDPLSSPISGSLAHRIDLDDAWLERDEHGAVWALSHRVLLSRGASLALGVGLGPEDAASGTDFVETAVACALAGACLRLSGDTPRETGRSLWIQAPDDDGAPPTGSTAVLVHTTLECGSIAVVGQPNDPARVIPNVDVRIIDQDGKPVAPKVVGEIAVRSSSVLESLPREDGYFRTGESGMLDDSGGLYVL